MFREEFTAIENIIADTEEKRNALLESLMSRIAYVSDMYYNKWETEHFEEDTATMLEKMIAQHKASIPRRQKESIDNITFNPKAMSLAAMVRGIKNYVLFLDSENLSAGVNCSNINSEWVIDFLDEKGLFAVCVTPINLRYPQYEDNMDYFEYRMDSALQEELMNTDNYSVLDEKLIAFFTQRYREKLNELEQFIIKKGQEDQHEHKNKQLELLSKIDLTDPDVQALLQSKIKK